MKVLLQHTYLNELQTNFSLFGSLIFPQIAVQEIYIYIYLKTNKKTFKYLNMEVVYGYILYRVNQKKFINQ